MKVSAVQPFGRLIEDAGGPTSEVTDQVRQFLANEGVCVIRGLLLTDDEFVAFLEHLGTLTFTVGETPAPECRQLNLVTNAHRSRPPRSVFHTDTSYVAKPPSITALRVVECPYSGGETLVTSQYLAYESLALALRERLQLAEVHHVLTGLEVGDDAETECWHPLFRRHPVSGQVAMYLSTPERCQAIRGVTGDPNISIQTLYEHCTQEKFTYRHQWRPGDLLLWDNRCTMHRADHSAVSGTRVMHRGMCAGEAPIPAFTTAEKGNLNV
ncbi:MAG: TauD/TfdA family dioxygenase [Pseudomonadota bacterium]